MEERLARILVVDDDATMRELVAGGLEEEGFCTEAVGSAEEALSLADQNEYDLFILDIVMDGMNGLELCRRLHSATSALIIIISSRGEDVDMVTGLDIGADDYLAKPFNIRVLAARVRALLRRKSKTENARVTAGGLTLDEDARTVTGDAGEICLSRMEFDLLAHLMENVGKVVSRDELLRDVWNWDSGTETKTVDTHIKRLRMKIRSAGYDPKVIVTVKGCRYEFAAQNK